MHGGEQQLAQHENASLADSTHIPSSSVPPPTQQGRTVPKDWRRRSADVGGLHLATTGLGQGQGWMGGESLPVETIYAELLSDMYTETMNSVNDNRLESVPPALPEAVRSRLIHNLSRWHFEPHKLPDEEVTACTLILFEALFRIEGMSQLIAIDMKQIIAFIYHLRRIYRYENTYHNFEHALDVLQATHCYLRSAGMVPPLTILFAPNQLWKPQKGFNSGSFVSCLGLREIFVLYVAAIGHDVGHPGLTNMFMKNANTPLSLIFDHTSALEQMHYQLLKRLMRHHGLGVLLDDPLHGRHIREILRSSVLFTDMGVHNDFMEQFKKLIEGDMGSISQRQIVVCQAILKNADISNPSRPFYVSTHWARALMQEWTAQANLEQEYDLKPSVMSSTDPIKEADSQIFFITRFLKPMLQLTVKAIPEMSCYLNHLKSNLRTWVKRKDDLSNQSSLPHLSPPPSTAPQQGQRISEEERVKKNGSVLGPPPVSAPSALSYPTDNRNGNACRSQAPSSSVSFAPNGADGPPFSPLLSTPRCQTDSFMTAFPLTLPTYPPKKYLSSDASWLRTTSSSSSSSRSVSEHEAGPLDSPSAESANEFPGSQSQLFSPISEVSTGATSIGNMNSKLQHVAHRCRSNSSLSSSSVCNQYGTTVNPSTAASNDANQVYPIWYSPTAYSHSNASLGHAAVDEQQHATTPHAAIRNASLLGSLRQWRQKDVGSAISLKDCIAAVDGPSFTRSTTQTARRAVRYSWCAGMAGLSGSAGILAEFRQYQDIGTSGGDLEESTGGSGSGSHLPYYSTLSRVSSEGGSPFSSSPEMPSARAPSLDCGDDTAVASDALTLTKPSQLDLSVSPSPPPLTLVSSSLTPTPQVLPAESLSWVGSP